MKSFFVACVMLLALFTAPAFADSINLTNQGVIASLGSGGITVISGITGGSFNGTSFTGPDDDLLLHTGIFTGSLTSGGSFSSGSFGFVLTSLGAFPSFGATDFAGTWTQLSDGVYQLLGTFSADVNGSLFNGTTTQVFNVGCLDGQQVLFDVSGSTDVATTVPEPGTLPLMLATLLGLSVAFQRKFQALRG